MNQSGDFSEGFFQEYRYIILASVGIIVAVFSLYFTQELHSSSANNIQM